MSLVSIAEGQGLDVLFGCASETLTFRSADISGLVNRAVVDEDRGGRPNFNLRNASEIEVQAADLETAPKPGESFTDASGFNHRIQLVQRTLTTYRCRCETSS